MLRSQSELPYSIDPITTSKLSYLEDNSAILLQESISTMGFDLDVGSGHPDSAARGKGFVVQRLKSYVIEFSRVGRFLSPGSLATRRNKALLLAPSP